MDGGSIPPGGTKTNQKHTASMLCVFGLEHKLLCVRVLVPGGDMFLLFLVQKQSSRGREHLVDFECNEKICLVIRDHKFYQRIRKTEPVYKKNKVGACRRVRGEKVYRHFRKTF